MSALNEIGASVVNPVAGNSPPRVERNEHSESKAVEVHKAQEQQADQVAKQNVALEASPQAVDDAVKAINSQVQRVSQNLKFSVDHDSGKVVVKIVDGETDKVLRQIPSEEALAISHALDKMKGLIIEQKA